MSSFWGGLVSTLSEGGKTLYATAAQDLADFSSSLKEDTTQLRQLLPPLPLPHADHAAVEDGTDDRAEDTGDEKEREQRPSRAAADSGDSASAAAAASTFPSSASSISSATSSFSSLGLGLERLSGHVGSVLHLLPSLPAVFGSDGSAASAPPLAQSSSPARSSSASSSEQRLLTVLRERSTFSVDPVPASSSAAASSADGFDAYRAAFLAACEADGSSYPSAYADAIDLLSRNMSVQRWHTELVSSGEVEEETFWCRALHAQHRLALEDRRRQKLQHRLQHLQQHSAAAAHGAQMHSPQPLQADEEQQDDLEWEDDDEEEQQHTTQQQLHEQQQLEHDDGDEEVGEEEREEPMVVEAVEESPVPSLHVLACESFVAQPSSSPPSSGASFAEGQDELSTVLVPPSPEAEVETLSPSPASSEGSGELVERLLTEEEEQQQQPLLQQLQAAASRATAETSAAAPDDDAAQQVDAPTRSTRTPQPVHDERVEEDYDEWE